jgi:hypothetical protein
VPDWTSGKARDLFYLKKQYNYAVTHRNMSAEKTAQEHETVHLKCNHRKTPKGPLCAIRVMEVRFMVTGLILFYEETSQVISHDLAGGFCSAHEHLGTSKGLSAELHRWIQKLANDCFSQKQIAAKVEGLLKSTRSVALFNDRQVRDAARLATSQLATVESGTDLEKFLMRNKDIVQLEEGDSLIAKQIVYGVTEDPCSMLTTRRWMQTLLDAEVLYLDGTYVKTADKDMAVVLTLLSRNNAGNILPVAVSVAHEESVDTIRKFFEFILTDLAREAGIEVNRDSQGRFRLPKLRVVMADAILGLWDLVEFFFGSDVIRGSCFFHICQAVRRWMVKEGFGHIVRGYADSLLRHLSLAETPAEFMFKLHMFKRAMRARASEGGDWIKADKLVNYLTEMLQGQDSANWARALIDPHQNIGRLVRALQQESQGRAPRARELAAPAHAPSSRRVPQAAQHVLTWHGRVS